MPDATAERSVAGEMMYRPEHDAKPLANIFNAIPWQTSFLFMRQFWQLPQME